MMDLVYALPALAVGLVFGAIGLPWKDSQWRNTSTLEYWTVWAVFWWALLPFFMVHAARGYFERWSHHLARKRYERNNP